ncbi:MAG: acyl-CoA thioesterase [Gammaproteobacteria bacterium]|nr:acyl-CoA thioesterase [Gammaproteobacteria bacterium]
MSSSKGRPKLPQRSDYRFFTPVPTRWGDADALGHINNVMFMRYIESGRLDYFEQVCNLLLEPGLKQGLVLASIKVDFIDQVHHPEQLVVGTGITRLGGSSFDIDASIFKPEQNNPVFTSHGIGVWFDFVNNKSHPIPPQIRGQIANFEEGLLT